MTWKPEWNGPLIASDLITDSGLGGAVEAQAVKILDGTTGGTNRLVVNPDGSIDVNALVDNLADTVVDPSLGTGKELVLKLADGTLGGYQRLVITSRGSALVEGPDVVAAAPAGRPVRPAAIAATALPGASTAGNLTEILADNLGRLIVRPVLPAERSQTSTTIGQAAGETTLVTGVTGAFHDLVLVDMSEAGGLATQVELRAATAGAVRNLVNIPAAQTVQLRFDLAFPNLNNVAAANWTAKVLTVGTSVQFYVQFLIR